MTTAAIIPLVSEHPVILTANLSATLNWIGFQQVSLNSENTTIACQHRAYQLKTQYAPTFRFGWQTTSCIECANESTQLLHEMLPGCLVRSQSVSQLASQLLSQASLISSLAKKKYNVWRKISWRRIEAEAAQVELAVASLPLPTHTHIHSQVFMCAGAYIKRSNAAENNLAIHRALLLPSLCHPLTGGRDFEHYRWRDRLPISTRSASDSHRPV